MEIIGISFIVTVFGLALKHCPPIKRMFRAGRVFLTQEYLEQEEFLRKHRHLGVDWRIEFSEEWDG